MRKHSLIAYDRYRIIADYPGRKTPIGTILFCSGNQQVLLEDDEEPKHIRPADYPAIFEKLHWSTRICFEDMPQYVKFVLPHPLFMLKAKMQVWHWFTCAPPRAADASVWQAQFEGDNSAIVNACFLEPITEDEYNERDELIPVL